MPSSTKKPGPEEAQEGRCTCGLQQLLTIEQVALLLQLSEQIVYRMAARAELPTIMFGRSIRVIPESLKQWLKEREQQQQS